MGSPRAALTPLASGTLTAREAGLIGCRTCARVWPAGTSTCARCGAPVESRDEGSVERVWAWLAAGLVLYVPANVYPMLKTAAITGAQQNTIVGGAIELVRHGNYVIAAIVFGASIMVPISKFVLIAYLALLIRSPRRAGTHRDNRFYEFVEFIGRWSMIDVFVVAILSALVQLGAVATIHPGVAAASFAASVACTMLAAQSVDPRMIWDRPEPAAPDMRLQEE